MIAVRKVDVIYGGARAESYPLDSPAEYASRFPSTKSTYSPSQPLALYPSIRYDSTGKLFLSHSLSLLTSPHNTSPYAWLVREKPTLTLLFFFSRTFLPFSNLPTFPVSVSPSIFSCILLLLYCV